MFALTPTLDALVAQVLGAATYPGQVAEADTFIKANYELTSEALRKAVDEKSWDPSVKALAQFPSVLDNLAKNIEWTSALGDALANQQADVLAAKNELTVISVLNEMADAQREYFSGTHDGSNVSTGRPV